MVGDLLPLAARLPLALRAERAIDWILTGSVALAGGLVSLPRSRSGRLVPAPWLPGQPIGSGG